MSHLHRVGTWEHNRSTATKTDRANLLRNMKRFVVQSLAFGVSVKELADCFESSLKSTPQGARQLAERNAISQADGHADEGGAVA